MTNFVIDIHTPDGTLWSYVGTSCASELLSDCSRASEFNFSQFSIVPAQCRMLLGRHEKHLDRLLNDVEDEVFLCSLFNVARCQLPTEGSEIDLACLQI